MKNTRTPYSPESSFIIDLVAVLHSDLVYWDKEAFGDIPSARQLSTLLNTAFWATLCAVEGRPSEVRIALVDVSWDDCSAAFGADHELSVPNLASLSPLLCDGITCIGVRAAGKRGSLKCWGIVWDAHYDGLVIRSRRPGQLIVSLNRDVVADVHPLRGPRILGPHVLNWDFRVPKLLRPVVPEEDVHAFARHLRHLAVAMQHGRGGTILFVGERTSAWADLVDIKYRLSMDSSTVRTAWERWSKESEEVAKRDKTTLIYMTVGTPAERAYRQLIDTIAGLTAVDGATLMTMSLGVIGFGAKVRGHGSPPSKVVRLNPHRPVLDEIGQGQDWTEVQISDIGGMRHQSAAQLVYEVADSVALVASQDGALTLFTSNGIDVCALPCESLLPLPV